MFYTNLLNILHVADTNVDKWSLELLEILIRLNRCTGEKAQNSFGIIECLKMLFYNSTR